MARPIMWLRYPSEKISRGYPSEERNKPGSFLMLNESKDYESVRRLLDKTCDSSHDENKPKLCTSNSIAPPRSYRCVTNPEIIQQFKQQQLDIQKEEEAKSRRKRIINLAMQNSLFIFPEKSIIRRICKYITENKFFDYFMLLTIVANCVVLAIATPLPNHDTFELNKKLDESDVVFVAIFLLEVVLRVIANGFINGPNAYLQSRWNILDFIVAVMGAVHILTTMGNQLQSTQTADYINALRVVRVLRPLKLVSGVPSLQVLMKSLVRAMVPLLQILLLVLFVIIIYSIIGLEVLQGRYHYACFNSTTDTLIVPISTVKLRPCDKSNFWGRKCGEGETCRRATAKEWAGPKDGITTFDNMFLSMLTIFQCITLEGWSEILYLTMDSKDKQYPFISWGAFILLIIIGSFFMLNLVLGVLSGEFAKERERVENRKSFLKLRKQRQMERQVEHYLDWIAKADEIEDDEDEYQEDSSANANTTQKSSVKSTVKITSSRKRKNGKLIKRKNHFLKKYEKKFRICIRHMTKSKVFYWLVLLLVLLNTVSMAMTTYNQKPGMKETLDTLEIVFTTLFFIEMLLRLYGLGIRGYFRSAFNKYDFVVVWLSLGDLVYKYVQDESSIGISVLRSVRLLRIFKVTRFWSSMQNVISSLMNSMRSILSLMLLLLLFIFIFALLGMQLFGGRFPTFYKGTPRTNFDHFFRAMLTVFQIMSGEDWNTVMYHGIMAYGGPKSASGLLVSFYFVALVIVGNYTLLNVFLAIAVDNLANAQVLTRDEEEELRYLQEQKRLRTMLLNAKNPEPSKWNKVRAVHKVLAFTRQTDKENPFKGVTYQGRPQTFIRAQSEPEPSSSTGTETGAERLRAAVLQAHIKYKSLDIPDGGAHKWRRAHLVSQLSFDSSSPASLKRFPPLWAKSMSFDTNSVTINENASADEGSPKLSLTSLKKSGEMSHLPLNLLPMPGSIIEIPGSSKVLQRRQFRTHKVVNTRSLFIFSRSSRIRTWCHYVVSLKHFERFMLVIIILSTLCLAIEDPLNSQALQNRIIYYLDIAFVTLFTFEITIKIIDQGSFLHKGSYLRDWWNVIDTIVVCCNIAATVLWLGQHKEVKAAIGESTLQTMRIMRVFRSLRVVNKIKELKLVCQCVVFSLKKTFNIIIIIMLCLFMFAVIGVNLFQGKFRYCTDPTKMTMEECQGNYFYADDPVNFPEQIKVGKREWKNFEFNFDNVSMAILTLFSCGTGEAWPIIMEKSIDATQVNEGPIQDNRMIMSLYYVAFVIVFSFFFLNIFVALIIVTFQEQGEKEITGSELDKNQRACLHFVMKAKPRQRFMPRDKSGFSYKVWRIVDSKPFEIVIMLLIALNAITLMFSTDSQTEYEAAILVKINVAFTLIFTIEALLKLMAYKLNYFRDSWNVFDFCIVFITLVGVIINYLSKEFPIDPSFFRLFRAFRLLKLLRQGYNIRILLWTFLQSLRGLPYVVLLILMMFFIYAVIGMQLFSKIELNDRKYITEYNNFRTFAYSLGVLFRCGTGEAWHLVMLDCFDDAPCYYDNTQKCGFTVAAVIYFVSFYFLYAFLLLNLFVAVIMDNFDYLTRDESILGPHHMDEFVRVWSEYDPSASGRIQNEDVYRLMCDMQPPVGFGKQCPKFLAYKRLMRLNMPISGDHTVQFTPTLFALVRTSLNMNPNDKACFRDGSFRKIIKRMWPNTTQKMLDLLIPEQTVLSAQQITIGKIYAAKLIYEKFKEMKRKKNCSLPQFEEFEATQHKRGNSLLRKIKGVLRTSSQPLSIIDKNPGIGRSREDYMNKRRRSNTMIDESQTHVKEPATRTRSVSNTQKDHDSFLTTRRRCMRQNSLFQSTPAINTVASPLQEQKPTSEFAAINSSSRNQGKPANEDRELTNSLITALRDPAKPILCFVNPQIHRECTSRTLSPDEDHGSECCGRTAEHTKSLSARQRQKQHVMVSLPMIKLEIPVTENERFCDLATTSVVTTTSLNENSNSDIDNNNSFGQRIASSCRYRSNTVAESQFIDEQNVPDLIKSTRKGSLPEKLRTTPSANGNNNQVNNASNYNNSSDITNNIDNNSIILNNNVSKNINNINTTDTNINTTDKRTHDENNNRKSCRRSSCESDQSDEEKNNTTNENSSFKNLTGKTDMSILSSPECCNNSNTNDDDSAKSNNRNILKTLNQQLNKALSDGVQPQWLYQITEDDGDTWC